MAERRIRLITPVIGQEEENLVLQVLRSGWLTEGPITGRLEKEFATFVGAKYAVAASSCTAAMEMSLRALQVKRGARILMPSFTHPATALAAIAVGAKPVLVDVDLETHNIDYEEVEANLSGDTGAIIAVSWGGMPLDNKRVDELKQRTMFLEDAACCVGAECNGVKTGTMAHLSCFSFHPRKPLTTGEGGIVTTDNESYLETLRAVKNFGATKKGMTEYGSNYKLSDVLAAIGVAQLAKLPGIIERRIKMANVYDKLLSDVKGVRPPMKKHGVRHTYQSYTVYVEIPGMRDKLIQQLKGVGIEAQIGTYALHLLPYYSTCERCGDLENSKLLAENLLTLPMSHDMTNEDQEFVVTNLEKLLKMAGNR